MQFKDIVGQKDLLARIIQLVKDKHLPHAMMLSGHAGSGGLPIALATAQFIVCTNKQESDSCGECAACVKMQKLQHPDVHFSFPVYKKKDTEIPLSDHFIQQFRTFILENPYATDTDWIKYLGTTKQANITALECREIIKKLQLRSFESEFKIMIIWYPEYLDKEGNILLKVIEEPTKKTLLFFVTEDMDAVLPTIQSRTQLFHLKRLSDVEIKSAIMDSGTNEIEATQIARLAEGNYNYAQTLLAHQDENMVEVLRNWLNWIYANKGIELVKWIYALTEKDKEYQKKFLAYVIQILEHMLRYKHMPKGELALLDGELKLIEILESKGLSPYRIAEWTDLLNESIYEIERNANTKILFHALSLRIQKLVHRKMSVS
ncbi:MAG: hypothetical protein IPI46_00930 [Bacteroidetes bacterium]|nr:hypothetical protein [Bacteroidota bacterium]